VDNATSVDRRSYERQLEAIDKKLDEHSSALNGIRETLSLIAVQSVQISSLQAMQSEMRGDINEIYGRVDALKIWQSSCPKASVKALWGVVVTVATAIGAAFLAHILGGVK
jgi:hypothetical protein